MRRITHDSRHPYQHLTWKITNAKKFTGNLIIEVSFSFPLFVLPVSIFDRRYVSAKIVRPSSGHKLYREQTQEGSVPEASSENSFLLQYLA